MNSPQGSEGRLSEYEVHTSVRILDKRRIRANSEVEAQAYMRGLMQGLYPLAASVDIWDCCDTIHIDGIAVEADPATNGGKTYRMVLPKEGA